MQQVVTIAIDRTSIAVVNIQKGFVMKIKVAAMLIGMTLAGLVNAQSANTPFYGEVGYTAMTIKGDGFKFKPGVARAIIGQEVHPNLAIEGMFGFGIKDDSITTQFQGTRVDIDGEIKHAYGFYLKPKLNVSETLEVFGRLGYNKVKAKLTARAGGFSASEADSDGDVAYGAGAKYNFSKTSYFSVDYMEYYKEEGTKANGLTFGFGMRF